MENNNIFENLVNSGAIELVGINDTGEALYTFSPKLKDIMPELYNMHMNFVNSKIMTLWEKGFVEMDLFIDNPRVTLSKNAFDQEKISYLNEEDKWSLEEIKRILSRQ